MGKVTLKLPDGTKREIKPFHIIEEPKITTDVLLLPRDIEALKNGYMVRVIDQKNSVAVCIRFGIEMPLPELPKGSSI